MSATYLSRHRDLGRLEDDVATVADKLGADLDQRLGRRWCTPSIH